MAIKKSAAVSAILERAEARLRAKPQLWASDLVNNGRKTARLLEALEAIAERRNPTETVEAHAIRVSRAAQKALAELDTLGAQADDTRTQAARNLHDQIQARSKLRDGPRGAEIRAIFRQMASEERGKLIEAAIASQDAETLGALLTAPAFLAGIDGDYQSRMRDHYELKVAPELKEALDEALAADESAAVIRRVAREAAMDAQKPDYIARILADQAEAEKAQAGFDDAMRA